MKLPYPIRKWAKQHHNASRGFLTDPLRWLHLRIFGPKLALEMMKNGDWFVYRYGRRCGPFKSYYTAAAVAWNEHETPNSSIWDAPWVAEAGGVPTLEVIRRQLNQRRIFHIRL